MKKRFSNIIELSEEHEHSSEEIPNPSSSKLKVSPSIYTPNNIYNHIDPTHLKLLESIQESNKFSEQEINLTSTESEKTPKDYQLPISIIDTSLLETLRQYSKTSKSSQEIALVKMKNFQEKFFFQIIKLSDASSHYLMKIDIKISNLEYLCQKIIQQYKTTDLNYAKILEKYKELLKERVLLQEKSDNNNALMISLRMAIESMNFTREQVSRLNVYDNKGLYKSFLDKIQAFGESVERYNRVCRKDDGFYEEFELVNRENTQMKEKIAQMMEENCRFKEENEIVGRKNRQLVKEMKEKEQKIALAKKKVEDFIFITKSFGENIEDETQLRFGRIEDKIKFAQETLEMIKINQNLLLKPIGFNEENTNDNIMAKLSEYNENMISNEKYKELEDKYKENLKETLDLKTENANLVSKLDTLLHEKNNLSLLYEEKCTKIDENEKQLKKSIKIIKKLEEQNAEIDDNEKINTKSLENTFSIQESSVSLQKKSKNAFESSDYDEKISELASKLNEKSLEVESLTVSMQKLEMSNDKLAEKCRKMMMKLQNYNDLEENARDIENENKSLNEKMQEKDHEIAKLKKRVKKLKSKNSKLMKNTDKLIVKVDRLEKTNKWLVENENINEMILEKIESGDMEKHKE
ncbi:hypothetical protein SteCoe_30371 [Stentor coeruleus]|uniref:Uncharacterized protein n=1 Tax=Stentor coeruleus TaxID=5963 RepID=A0A1R2B3P2_9CILI|nr:hypothetical protein SteCoe_30371 [Stentor coeruleus]